MRLPQAEDKQGASLTERAIDLRRKTSGPLGGNSLVDTMNCDVYKNTR